MRGEERKPAVVLERLVEENGALRARLAVAEGVIARAVGVAEKAGGLGVLVEADGLTEVGAILSEAMGLELVVVLAAGAQVFMVSALFRRALRRAWMERDALAAWSCRSCGASFTRSATPAELDGVTRCSTCVLLEVTQQRLVRALRALREAGIDWEG